MILLIAGPAGAGKSTVSKLLSQKFKKSALIEVDEIRHMIKKGEVSPFKENIQSERQLKLGVVNSCSLAQNFAGEAFDVLIDDVVSKKDRLDLYYEKLKGLDLKVFLLLPDEETIKHRDAQRKKDSQMKDRAILLHRRFQKLVKTEKRWTVIDSSNQTPEETVKEIINLLDMKGL